MMLKNSTLVEDGMFQTPGTLLYSWISSCQAFSRLDGFSCIAFQQMKAVIERFLHDPFASQFIRKIVDCIVELRAQSIRFDRRSSAPSETAVEPRNARSVEFNSFLRRVCEMAREAKLLGVARMCRDRTLWFRFR